ncbi:hypothetical protein GBA52_025495 [Prunus armeniaca]|nr:hypothetical protein GBA52_025495 [Prunus armeniaca]
MGELWTQLGSVTASMMFAYAMFKQFFPDDLGNILEKYTQKLVGYVYPYIQISFDEYTVEFLRRSEVYSSIQSYLSTKSSTRAKRLKAHDVKGSKALVLGMDDNEEVTDEFQGIKLWWVSMKSASKKSSFSFYPEYEDRKQYKLTFHRRHRDIVMGSYLDHVRQEGKAIAVSNRQRKLYINNTGKALEAAKVEARVKAEEEARKKAEEEAKLKAEKEEKEKAKSGNSKDEVKCNGTKDEVKCNGTKDELKGTSVAEVKENGVTP